MLITNGLHNFHLKFARSGLRVSRDDLEIMAEHHVGEESLPPQQQRHVTVTALTPGQHQKVGAEFLQIFNEFPASSVVRSDIHNLMISSYLVRKTYVKCQS